MGLERARAKRAVAKSARKLPVIERLEAIPGIKSVEAPAGPDLERSGPSGRRPGAPRCARRSGKRVIFIAAEAAIRGDNAFARRCQARIAAGCLPVRESRRHADRGAPQGDSRCGAQDTFHGVRDHEDRKGVRRWPGKCAEGPGRRPAGARLSRCAYVFWGSASGERQEYGPWSPAAEAPHKGALVARGPGPASRPPARRHTARAYRGDRRARPASGPPGRPARVRPSRGAGC